MEGRLHTRYAPVRRSLPINRHTPRLACVKPAASVHPEPGSNSSSYILILYYRCLFYRFFSNLSIPLLLFFCCLIFQIRRLSIQYVYERCFFCIPLVFQSGCKTKNSFCFLQEKFKKILKLFFRFPFPISLPIFQWTFRVLRGANVKSFFFSRKLFPIFFSKISFRLYDKAAGISKSVFRCCGCKSSAFFRFSNSFQRLF